MTIDHLLYLPTIIAITQVFDITIIEALCRRICRFMIGCFMLGEFVLIGPEMIYEAMEKVRFIRDKLKTAQS